MLESISHIISLRLALSCFDEAIPVLPGRLQVILRSENNVMYQKLEYSFGGIGPKPRSGDAIRCGRRSQWTSRWHPHCRRKDQKMLGRRSKTSHPRHEVVVRSKACLRGFVCSEVLSCSNSINSPGLALLKLTRDRNTMQHGGLG